MKEIIFKVAPDGKVEADASGFAGGECLDFANSILENLGLVTEMREKPEMNIKGKTPLKGRA